MLRLLAIDFAKMKRAKYFRVLVILTLLAFVLIPTLASVIPIVIDSYAQDSGGWMLDDFKIRVTDIPLMDFEDIWQNIAYAYKWITVLISFMVVISITNEFDYKTARQNIIDGLSRKEFLLSKIYTNLAISVGSSLIMFVVCIILGFLFSAVKTPEFIFMKIEFLFAYFLHVFAFLSFATLVAFLIKRGGFAIALLIFYVYIVEAILYGMMNYEWEMPILANALPMESVWNLIRLPYKKYILFETQDFLSFHDLSLGLIWSGVFIFCSWLLLKKRDLG